MKRSFMRSPERRRATLGDWEVETGVWRNHKIRAMDGMNNPTEPPMRFRDFASRRMTGGGASFRPASGDATYPPRIFSTIAEVEQSSINASTCTSPPQDLTSSPPTT